MKRVGLLLLSFDKSWGQFTPSWKKARSTTKKKSVHILRVSARRLISTLELTQSISRDAETTKLRRRFKKVLKRMGPIRDVQVQLAHASNLRQTQPIQAFKKTLEHREGRLMGNIREELSPSLKHQISAGVKNVQSRFARLQEKLTEDRIQRSVERILKIRWNEFLRTRRRFQPSDNESLHEMRIALKKLRYSVEAAQPMLNRSATKQARDMQALQKLMGDIRDIDMLRTELDKWAAKKGNKMAIVPELERLLEKRDVLLKRISESSKSLEAIYSTEDLKPTTEKTMAAGAAASIAPRPADAGRPDLLLER